MDFSLNALVARTEGNDISVLRLLPIFALTLFLGWKDVKAMDFFGEIVQRVAIRVLLCEDLCRDENFIRRSMSFQESIFITALVIIKLPLGPLRRFLAWPISSLHRWKLRHCMNLLRPVLEKRLSPRNIKKPDAIQWTLDLFPVSDLNITSDRLMMELLHNLWAGSSAPGGMLTEVVYQLLLHDAHLGPLRKEAAEAVDQYGWTDQMLNSLHLQDSFIRETNRLFPTGSREYS